jgi:site-specific recombinase XerD
MGSGKAITVATGNELAPLADLLEAADATEAHAWADNTRRAYTGDVARFAAWARSRGLTPLPAAPATVRAYVAHLEQEGRKLSTIRRALAAISQAHQQGGLPSPVADTAVRTLVKAVAKKAAKAGRAAPRRAPALSPDQVGTMAVACGEGLRGLRDRALLLVGFAGAFRRSELVALDVADLRFVVQGAEALVRVSKTDQAGAGLIKAIAYASDSARCPVRALRAWLDAAGIAAGPVFREITRHGRLESGACSPRAVDRAIKRAAQRAGLDLPVSGHSLRAGFITSARRAGHRAERIRAVSGHKEGSRVFDGYIREADVWADHAGAGVL